MITDRNEAAEAVFTVLMDRQVSVLGDGEAITRFDTVPEILRAIGYDELVASRERAIEMAVAFESGHEDLRIKSGYEDSPQDRESALMEWLGET